LFVFLTVFSQSVISQENNPEFSVVYSEGLFYCGGNNYDNIGITIKLKNEIDAFPVIRLEVFWRESVINDTLIKLFEKKIEMKQNTIVIKLPLSWDGEIMSALEELEDYLYYDTIDDYNIAIKIYFNDVLISENSEIWVACATSIPF
jgi:hypothetical protein